MISGEMQSMTVVGVTMAYYRILELRNTYGIQLSIRINTVRPVLYVFSPSNLQTGHILRGPTMLASWRGLGYTDRPGLDGNAGDPCSRKTATMAKDKLQLPFIRWMA